MILRVLEIIAWLAIYAAIAVCIALLIIYLFGRKARN